MYGDARRARDSKKKLKFRTRKAGTGKSAWKWSDSRQSQFQVGLEIVMEDRQGILARVVTAIANLKTNIRQMETRSNDGKASVALVLEIADLKQLEKVTRSLSAVVGCSTSGSRREFC